MAEQGPRHQLYDIPLTAAGHQWREIREQTLLEAARYEMARLAKQQCNEEPRIEKEHVDAVLKGLDELTDPGKRALANWALASLPRSGEFLQGVLLAVFGAGVGAALSLLAVSSPAAWIWIGVTGCIGFASLAGAIIVWRKRRPPARPQALRP